MASAQYGLQAVIPFHPAAMPQIQLRTFPDHTLTRGFWVSYDARMKQMLTTKTLDALKPPTGKRYEVRDSKVTGLHIRVSNSGAKVFYMSTRADGRRRRTKIGPYPTWSLADARKRAAEIARSVELGEFDTPTSEVAAIAPTFAEVAEQFIELHAKPNTKDWKGTQSILRKFDRYDDTPINEIKRTDIVSALDAIVASGTPMRANRALAAIKKLMNWCVDRGMIEVSPVASLRPPTREVKRDRVLTYEELATIWRAANEEGFPFAPFLQLLVLTGQRRGEVAGMRWSEIDFDQRLWTLPSERSKNGLLHVVPLSAMALEILASLPRFLDSEFVFTTTGRTPISGFGRLKERIDAALPENTPNWRFHDLRRTASTEMARLGVDPHVIDAVTNHKSGAISGVSATYIRYSYLNEKRTALDAWADEMKVILARRSLTSADAISVSSLA